MGGIEPTLVETGPETSSEAVHRGLGSLGLGPADLAHVIVTEVDPIKAVEAVMNPVNVYDR